MKFTELLNEDKKLAEAIPKSKSSNAFGQMAKSLAGVKPNTMSNAPVSTTNKAKPGNPNVPSYGKGTAMPTKPLQIPGAGTNPTPKAATPPGTQPVTPTAKTEPTASNAAPETPQTAQDPTAAPETPQTAQDPTAAPEKNGLLYKMGKGIGDFGRGFKIGYGGRMPTDADVVPDDEPNNTDSKNAGVATPPAGAASSKEPSDYVRIKANVDKLDKKDKQRVLAMLQKELGITPTAKSAPTTAKPAAPGAGAFGQMATQLSTPKQSQSSTGGEIAKTPTGTQHTANPVNPNVASKQAALPAVTPKPVAPVKPVRTGGKVAGQVSQTPNAIRKRNARVTAKPVQTAGLDQSGNMISESFSFFRKK